MSLCQTQILFILWINYTTTHWTSSLRLLQTDWCHVSSCNFVISPRLFVLLGLLTHNKLLLLRIYVPVLFFVCTKLILFVLMRNTFTTICYIVFWQIPIIKLQCPSSIGRKLELPVVNVVVCSSCSSKLSLLAQLRNPSHDRTYLNGMAHDDWSKVCTTVSFPAMISVKRRLDRFGVYSTHHLRMVLTNACCVFAEWHRGCRPKRSDTLASGRFARAPGVSESSSQTWCCCD